MEEFQSSDMPKVREHAAPTLLGSEPVPQSFSQEGYTIRDVVYLMAKIFCSPEVKRVPGGLRSLEAKILFYLEAQSNSLDHVSTIPHGINHVMRVASFMVNIIPRDIPFLRVFLDEKYGPY